MGECTSRVTFWCLTTAMITIIVIYIIFRMYIYFRVEAFYDNVNEVFINFCEQVSEIIYREEVYIPYKNGIYEKELAVALLDISLNTTKSTCPKLSNLPNPPGFDQQIRIEGIDPNNGQTSMYAYIFWNQKLAQVVISFTGTATPSQFYSDFQYQQVPPTEINNYTEGVLVHKGFYNIYMSIRDKLWEWWKENYFWVEMLYITGHSLGGALSTICSFDFADVISYPVHYAFASPRCGNPNFARIFNKIVPTSLRINNTCDVVPQLPPASWQGYVYEEVGGNIPFTLALPTLRDDHIVSYVVGLPECPQVSPCYLENLDRVCFNCPIIHK